MNIGLRLAKGSSYCNGTWTPLGNSTLQNQCLRVCFGTSVVHRSSVTTKRNELQRDKSPLKVEKIELVKKDRATLKVKPHTPVIGPNTD